MKWMGINELREKYLSFFEYSNYILIICLSCHNKITAMSQVRHISHILLFFKSYCPPDINCTAKLK
jgi:hypothetical protein